MGTFRENIFNLLYHAGIGGLMLKRNRRKLRIPVIVLHRIVPEHDPVWPGMHPELLDELLTLLKKHYMLRPLSDLLNLPDAELKGSCFITFDDGYQDFQQHALPVLRKHQVPSALFVVPEQPSNGGRIWTMTLSRFTGAYSEDEILRFLSEHGLQASLKGPKTLFALNLQLGNLLSVLPHKKRQPIIRAMEAKLSADGKLPEKDLLSLEALRTIGAGLVETASHSISHSSFETETDAAFIEQELKGSKDLLEKELKREVYAFAFPFAKYNQLSLSMVRQHYRLCFTSTNNFVELGKLREERDYVYNLSRFYLHHSSAKECFFLINGFHRSIRKLF